LHRMFRYIRAHTRLGLLFEGHPGDLNYLIIRMFTDADQAGDVADTKSTSGGDVFIEGPRTKLPIAFMSRKQTVTELSTGSSEMVAFRDVTYQEAVPLVGLLELMLQRAVRLIGEIDSEAARGAIRRGYSRKLAYLKKTQRVAISGLHELFHGEGAIDLEPDDSMSINRCNHVPGDKNVADLYTKALPAQKHWWCAEAANMVVVTEEHYKYVASKK
jgi:hypothetical protein